MFKEKITRSEVKKKETEIFFEDERWLVLFPLSVRSSNLYGKSTKWCVSSEDHNYGKYFKQYTDEGVLIFVIDKTVTDELNNDFPKVPFTMTVKNKMVLLSGCERQTNGCD